MRIALFYHSLLSCWNNGHAHFLRGYAGELQRRGHDVRTFEPAEGWSRMNLLAEYRQRGLEPPPPRMSNRYPKLRAMLYTPDVDLDAALDGVDLVIAHEWNDQEFIRRLGAHRQRSDYLLLFHDTHHRAVTAPDAMSAFDFSGFDGGLVYGEVLREMYLRFGWLRNVWTWHEAADTRIFRPPPFRRTRNEGDLVWIGNWGDGERTRALQEFLIEPIRKLRLRASIYGVRYPEEALIALHRASAAYKGWLPNALAPEAFARHRLTVHLPRRPYVETLPGIPTIRIFEALACGIPLISAPWSDVEHLFTPGSDYLVAKDGDEMAEMMKHLLESPGEAQQLAQHGLATIRRRHTVAHRVDELLTICRAMGLVASEPPPAGMSQQPIQEVIA